MDLLLDRSRAFEDALFGVVGGIEPIDGSPRHLVCESACLLAIEHATSVRTLFAAGLLHSGTALVRVQYEAVLRGAWVLYAANEPQVSLLSETLDLDSEHAANKLPGPGDMLSAIVRVGPAGLTQPLQEFRTMSIKALNSFVHGGIHPVRRMGDGFPIALAVNIMRTSNGLMHLSFRLLASLSGSQEQMNQATQLHEKFRDCLPTAGASAIT